MRNATWVCFECREAVRRPNVYLAGVPCPMCGVPCNYLGYRIRIPSKSNCRGWQQLRLSRQNQRLESLEVQVLEPRIPSLKRTEREEGPY